MGPASKDASASRVLSSQLDPAGGNVARASGERIYHLPFDQQYDTTVVEPDRGECFVATVAEAEQLGFRRAWRWHAP